jgi:hypothetical protein
LRLQMHTTRLRPSHKSIRPQSPSSHCRYFRRWWKIRRNYDSMLHCKFSSHVMWPILEVKVLTSQPDFSKSGPIQKRQNSCNLPTLHGVARQINPQRGQYRPCRK